MKKSRELKGLQSQLTKVLADIKTLKLEKSNVNKKEELLQQQKKKLEQKIKDLNKSNDNKIIVSEHAMLRYIERVMGLDLEEFRKKIITPEFIESYEKCHKTNGQYPFTEGHVAKVRNNTVITII